MSVNYGWMVDIINASRHDISDNYMGTNCLPLLRDFSLYLYCIKTSQEKRSFICTFHYIDDVLSLNNSKFGDFCRIYLSAWNKDTTKTTKSASYPNLHLDIDSEDQVRTKVYDERDDLYIYIYILVNRYRIYVSKMTTDMLINSYFWLSPLSIFDFLPPRTISYVWPSDLLTLCGWLMSLQISCRPY